jgi:hypothetical protein
VWQVVAIGQQAGFEVHLDPLVSALRGSVLSVGPLDANEVRLALQSVPALAQHAHDEPFVALLGNIRTLAWIIAAAPLFAGVEAGQFIARSRIADRLWAHWTGGDPDLHSFMIRLARRDAEYERSFALSDLSQEDRTAWKAGRQRMPLAFSPRGRLSFEHDLASDWARYQYLKEIGRDFGGWSRFASQPLWVAGLRLFGQYLLREPDQACDGWDWAFARARTTKATDALDVLLDALCLDPMADVFLSERAELLFAEKGNLLDRLLARFLHVATFPDRAWRAGTDTELALYVEAEMRSPLWSVWPPVIRFLSHHRETIAAFGSATVAKLCEMWLTKAPMRIGDRPVIGRSELAELALETARVHQIANIAHGTYGSHSDRYKTLFKAALAGAEDCLEPVTQFALEMARRRPLARETQARVNALRAQIRQQREGRMEERARRQRSKSLASFDFVRKLPPWPIGPAGRLDAAFREVVLKKGALNALMRCAPGVAAEILLACIVEDNPHEEPNGMHFDWRLGLDHHHDDQPTIFWNSPFFPFLLAAPEPALEALLCLLEFCTERWASREAEQQGATFKLAFSVGTVRSFVGDRFVLDWSQTRRTTNSQLFMALDALERWLWLKMEGGEDIQELCRALLEGSRSAAILGILANCAKCRPQLLSGVLQPLLTSPMLLVCDEIRIGQRGFGGDLFAWYRAGEAVRMLAAEWEHAPHRKATLKEVIRDLRRASPEFDAQARGAFDLWPEPEPDFDLRQRALWAELDHKNWQQTVDSAGGSTWQFQYPADIAADIEAVREAAPPTRTLAVVLKQLESMLSAPLEDHAATELYKALDQHVLEQFGTVEQRVIQTAIAAVLVTRAGTWVRQNPDAAERLSSALQRSVPLDTGEPSDLDGSLDFGPGLAWACLGAVSAKVNDIGSPEAWDRILAYGVATGDAGVIGTIITAAYPSRERLGNAWWGIVQSAVWAAALDALRPRMDGDPGSMEVIGRWRLRLARRHLSGKDGYDGLDLLGTAERVERLWRSRFRRQFGEKIKPRLWRGKHRRYSLGMSTHILTAIFDWTLNTETDPLPEERAEHRQILRQLWRFVEWRLRGDPDEQVDDHDGYDRVDDFGLSVIRVLAARIPLGSASESRELWEPVLALGPRGEFTVEHLIDCLFLRLYKDVDPANFVSNWRAMLAHVFTPGWLDGGRWYKGRSILRHMLGIDAANQLAACPPVMAHVADLAPYFESFAGEHIAHDDSTLASFAYFVASDAGEPLRLPAIQWIETAIAQEERRLRDNASGALAELANALLTRHGAELVSDRATLIALNNVIGRMVRDQAPLALALQDRARALR